MLETNMRGKPISPLWLSNKLNRKLTEGLKHAIVVIEGWDDFSTAKKRSTAEYARQLVAMSEEILGRK